MLRAKRSRQRLWAKMERFPRVASLGGRLPEQFAFFIMQGDSSLFGLDLQKGVGHMSKHCSLLITPHWPQTTPPAAGSKKVFHSNEGKKAPVCTLVKRENKTYILFYIQLLYRLCSRLLLAKNSMQVDGKEDLSGINCVEKPHSLLY